MGAGSASFTAVQFAVSGGTHALFQCIAVNLNVPIVLKSGSLNLLEPSGPVKACNGIALPLLVSNNVYGEVMSLSKQLRSNRVSPKCFAVMRNFTICAFFVSILDGFKS
jgi:hypothetical protein